LLLGVAGTATAADPTKPNVVFILADDLGWADTAPYGSTFHDTPNLKRLADRGVRFTQAYAACPLCSPTRCSILTGLYPARVGITSPACHLPQVQLEKKLAPGRKGEQVLAALPVTRLKTEYVTLAEILKRDGYATAHFGKWHLGHGAGYEPRDQGFDQDVPHTPRAAGPGGGYLAPWRFIADPAIKPKPGEHIEDWLSARAAEYIAAHKDRPFYLNYWAYSVHGPWNARRELIERFQRMADPKAGQRNPLYAAMVKSLDDAVGRLLDAVDKAGIADRTVIVFTSDNGGFAYPPNNSDPPGYDTIPATSNAPMRSGKASLYEGGTRVPFLVTWPGAARPGTTADALFSSVDFLPTLLEVCGVKPDAGLKPDGVSQVAAVRGEGRPRDTVYCHFPHGSAAQAASKPGFYPGTYVRKGDWKLIRFYAANDDQSDRLELYDLKSDISETKDRTAERPEVVKQLSDLMARFLADTEAVVPRANPNYRLRDPQPQGSLR
jgi:arylsulfatase A-like enzyme